MYLIRKLHQGLGPLFVCLWALIAPAATSAQDLEQCVSINFGDLLEGEISQIGELDLFCFEANTGDVVVIVMSKIDGTLDPFLELYDPDGNLVDSDNDSGVFPNARIDAPLPLTGTYTIIARDLRNNATGGYHLNLDRVSTTLAEICGVVTDPEGNPLNGVSVIATNIGTQEKTRVKTADDGSYAIFNLDPGTYRLLCIKQGYKLAVKKVEAPPNEKTIIDFVLELK